MRAKTVRVLVVLGLAHFVSLTIGCASLLPPTAATLANADYGTYPSNYEEIAKDWIKKTFFDPYTVQDLVISAPAKHWEWYKFEGPCYGYVISVSCNAKNRMGGYTGRQVFYLLIRNGIPKVYWTEEEPYIKTPL